MILWSPSGFPGATGVELAINIKLPPRLRRESPGGVIDHPAEREQGLLAERAADELEPERQSVA